MALFDDIPLFEEILSGGNWATGLAIGVGAVVVLPLAVPILRPLAKTAIKGGILAYRGAAGWVEGVGDLVAEAVAQSGGWLARRPWKERRRPLGWRGRGEAERKQGTRRKKPRSTEKGDRSILRGSVIPGEEQRSSSQPSYGSGQIVGPILAPRRSLAAPNTHSDRNIAGWVGWPQRS